MIEAYLKLQMALDDEYYGVVIEPYYRDTMLSFVLAYWCLRKHVPSSKFLNWGSSKAIDHDALLFAVTSRRPSHIIDHFDMVLQYLRSPSRSRQYSMKLAGGRLYSNALLYCLHCVHGDEESHGVYSVDRLYRYTPKYFRSYDQRDNDILSQWTQNGSRNNQEDDWRGAADTALNPSSYLESLQTLYEDDWSIHNDPPQRWSMDLVARKSKSYYIDKHLLQDALYFFPRAGRCDKLLDLCKTKYLPKNVLSPEDEGIVFRAMDAYVDRWKDSRSGSPEIDEWAYPLPLVERRVSIFIHEEKEAILKIRAQSSR